MLEIYQVALDEPPRRKNPERKKEQMESFYVWGFFGLWNNSLLEEIFLWFAEMQQLASISGLVFWQINNKSKDKIRGIQELVQHFRYLFTKKHL